MTSAIKPSSVSPASLLANVQASASPNAAQRDGGFAQLLSQRQAMAAQEAQKPPVAQPVPKPAAAPPAAPPAMAASSDAAQTASGSAASNTANANAQAAKSNAARAPAKPVTRERAPAKADKPQAQDARTKASSEATSEAKAKGQAEATDEPAAMDPALADWMANLNRPAPAADTPTGLPAGQALLAQDGKAGKEGVSDGVSLDAGQEGDATGAGAAAGARKPRGGLGAEGDAAGAADCLRGVRDGQSTDAVSGKRSTQEAWQAAVEQAAPVQATTQPDAFDSMAAAAQAGAPAATAEAAAPTAVTVPTPVNAPEFPKDLGLQISVLARDGVQQAELHLNPGDMGPISVQIALDGTQAQVNFGVDSADTRQIIENGLPELAAAMRDAGFTLSGGGVHQQASGQQGDGRSDSQGRGAAGRGDGTAVGGNEPAAATPQHIRTRIASGGVDTYA